jgi:hypothetical protein
VAARAVRSESRQGRDRRRRAAFCLRAAGGHAVRTRRLCRHRERGRAVCPQYVPVEGNHGRVYRAGTARAGASSFWAPARSPSLSRISRRVSAIASRSARRAMSRACLPLPMSASMVSCSKRQRPRQISRCLDAGTRRRGGAERGHVGAVGACRLRRQQGQGGGNRREAARQRRRRGAARGAESAGRTRYRRDHAGRDRPVDILAEITQLRRRRQRAAAETWRERRDGKACEFLRSAYALLFAPIPAKRKYRTPER